MNLSPAHTAVTNTESESGEERKGKERERIDGATSETARAWQCRLCSGRSATKRCCRFRLDSTDRWHLAAASWKARPPPTARLGAGNQAFFFADCCVCVCVPAKGFAEGKGTEPRKGPYQLGS